jgi:plastocyanin
MKRFPVVPAVLLVASLVALLIFSVVMAATTMGDGSWGMMGGHMGMMGGQGSDPAEETPVAGITQVRLQNFAFAPANIVVDAGTTVTWANYDNVGHTVTSDEGDELDSEILGEGETFSYTFTQPGEYRYHCTPHPNMQGLVTVVEAGAQP